MTDFREPPINHYGLEISMTTDERKPFYLTGDKPLFKVRIHNTVNKNIKGQITIIWKLENVINERRINIDVLQGEIKEYDMDVNNEYLREWCFIEGTARYYLQDLGHPESKHDEDTLKKLREKRIIHPLCSYYIYNREIYRHEKINREERSKLDRDMHKYTRDLRIYTIVITIFTVLIFLKEYLSQFLIYIKDFLENINFMNNVNETIMAISNVVLALIVFIQLINSEKPLISTKMHRKSLLDINLEYNNDITIQNISENIAKYINIEYQFKFDDKIMPKIKEKELSHLNPGECANIPLKFKEIIESYPELFEDKIETNKKSKKIPKKIIEIDLTVLIYYKNPLIPKIISRYIPFIGFYKLEDNYLVEWGSYERYPNFNEHPVFFSYNKRDGYDINKENDNIKTIK